MSSSPCQFRRIGLSHFIAHTRAHVAVCNRRGLWAVTNGMDSETCWLCTVSREKPIYPAMTAWIAICAKRPWSTMHRPHWHERYEAFYRSLFSVRHCQWHCCLQSSNHVAISCIAAALTFLSNTTRFGYCIWICSVQHLFAGIKESTFWLTLHRKEYLDSTWSRTKCEKIWNYLPCDVCALDIRRAISKLTSVPWVARIVRWWICVDATWLFGKPSFEAFPLHSPPQKADKQSLLYYVKMRSDLLACSLATTACWNYFGAWEQKNVIRKIKRLVIYSAARNAPPAVTEQMMATLLNDDNLYNVPLWRIADRLGPHDPSLSLATQRAASDMCLSNYYETFHPKLATFDAGSLE